MEPETEILVHITAPSTSTDDAYYRLLALAYRDFDYCTRIDITSADTSAHTRPVPPPAELLSPQASFRSVWDNVRPPPACPQHSQQDGTWASQDGGQSQDSWVAPPSEVGDSMPDNDITLDGFTTPTRVLNYFIQTMDSPSEASQESGRRDITTMYEGAGDFTALLAKGAGTADLEDNSSVPPASVVQPDQPASGQYSFDTRWSTPEVPEARSAARSEETHVTQTPSSPVRSRGSLPPSHLVSTEESRAQASDDFQSSLVSGADSHDTIIPSTQLPERAVSEPPSSKRRKPNPPNENGHHGLGRSTSDVLPRRSENAQSRAADNVVAGSRAGSPEPPDYSDLTEIVSAEPAPANHKLGPRPPALLEAFVRDTGMKERYRPRFQARQLRSYERGYWLLDLDGWSRDARVEAWGFLGNFILRDRKAGWGARACRDERWGWIRLYGWEHIAEELYILLYYASFRRMKRMDVTWYDGAGKELIVVGARSDKSILE